MRGCPKQRCFASSQTSDRGHPDRRTSALSWTAPPRRGSKWCVKQDAARRASGLFTTSICGLLPPILGARASRCEASDRAQIAFRCGDL